MEFSRALGAYWTVVQRANRFIEEQRPWDLAKESSKHDRLRDVLRELVAVLWTSGRVLSPFMPVKMEEMLSQLGSPDIGIGDLPPNDIRVEGLRAPRPLFPRIQEDPENLFTE
jgi:methionyl-tRNA synthetase